MSVTTIILIALAFGLSYYSKYKKSLAEQTVLGDGADADAEEEDYFDSMEDEEPAEVETPGYFTYETTDSSPVQAAPTPEPRKASPAPAPVMAAAIEAPAVQFDLRQAVVAQVILDNKYFNEIN